MRVLLIDNSAYEPTSPLFLSGLRTLANERGIHFRFVDEKALYSSTLTSRVIRRALGRPFHYKRFNESILSEAARLEPDVVVVVKGAYVAPRTLQVIKERFASRLINYSTDSIFNPATTTPDLRSGLCEYDVYATPRTSISNRLKMAGAKRIEFVPFGYHPDVHFPVAWSGATRPDVVFIGGADPSRVAFIRQLIARLGRVQLELFGGYWHRYADLKPYYRGMAIGEAFRRAAGGARIALNLVRTANEDGHTMKTFEIPACGGFMLATRSPDHEAMFEEDREASMFADVDECASKIRYFLDNPDEAQTIAGQGCERVTRGHNTYLDRLRRLLEL
jgi:hypothetical protein